MAKAISINVSNIPPADRARVQAAVHGKFSGQLGTSVPGDVTAAHIVELLEDRIKGWVLGWERSASETSFNSGFSDPALET